MLTGKRVILTRPALRKVTAAFKGNVGTVLGQHETLKITIRWDRPIRGAETVSHHWLADLVIMA